MAPPMLAPLPKSPAGQWTYQAIDGAECRDGSPAGLYTRFSTTDSKHLLIYLEGGGACFNSVLCSFNPATVQESVGPGGRDIATTASQGLLKVMQAPGTEGIFDFTNPKNPYADWNMVYVPYCTGDVFAGTRKDAIDPQIPGTQQFVGYLNMQKFVGHIVPTFAGADRVVLTGVSAGSFGAGMNFNQVQDAFGKVPVTLIMDSGIQFLDTYMPSCLQQRWRELWGLDAALPPDCTECRHADGSGFANLIYYSARKYPSAKLGMISAVDDGVMSFFFAFGENDCKGGGPYPAGKYKEALLDLRTHSEAFPGRFASYFVLGQTHTYEETSDFYDLPAEKRPTGYVPMVDWMTSLLSGNATQVGP
jgi:hypothetical protein